MTQKKENENCLIISSKGLRGEDEYRIFSVRIRKTLLKKLELIVRDTGRSRNEIIGPLLEYAVNHCIWK